MFGNNRNGLSLLAFDQIFNSNDKSISITSNYDYNNYDCVQLHRIFYDSFHCLISFDTKQACQDLTMIYGN
jgi:hypothetical protein